MRCDSRSHGPNRAQSTPRWSHLSNAMLHGVCSVCVCVCFYRRPTVLPGPCRDWSLHLTNTYSKLGWKTFFDFWKAVILSFWIYSKMPPIKIRKLYAWAALFMLLVELCLLNYDAVLFILRTSLSNCDATSIRTQQTRFFQVKFCFIIT